MGSSDDWRAFRMRSSFMARRAWESSPWQSTWLKACSASRRIAARLLAGPVTAAAGSWPAATRTFAGWSRRRSPGDLPLADGKVDEEPSLGSHIIRLDHVAEINGYCASLGITLSTLLQFAWAMVLRTYTGADDVLFGYLASGRDVPVPHIEQAVGAFINMLVCRMHLPADTEIDEALDTNFWGPLHAIRAVLPEMRRRRAGRILNVASIGGKIGTPHLAPYSASKFALVGLSEALRAELAREGIVVTTVCPGLMRTGSPRHAYFKGRHRAEFAWFSISDSLPGLSMDAERAARQVVAALCSGEAERVLSLPAKIGALAHAMSPGLTLELMAIANRLLPTAGDEARLARVKGEDSTSTLAPSFLTRLGTRAEARHNQTAGSAGRA